jgi:hypothetical protein
MASNTKALKVRRKMKRASNGAKRKRVIRMEGTTAPLLPLNKPNANETQQKQKRAAAK